MIARCQRAAQPGSDFLLGIELHESSPQLKCLTAQARVGENFKRKDLEEADSKEIREKAGTLESARSFADSRARKRE